MSNANDTFISALFPSSEYYVQGTDFKSVLDPCFQKIVDHLTATHVLARHIRLLPDYVVMHKSHVPQRGTLFVRLFDNEISLPAEELSLYKQFFPCDRFLLISLKLREHLWLDDYPNARPAKGEITL